MEKSDFGTTAREVDRHDQMFASLGRLVQWFLARIGDESAEGIALDGFTVLARELMPGATACSIAAYTPDGARITAATDATAMKIGRYQCRVGDGPAIRAALDDAVVEIDDIGNEARWPRFASHAAALGIGSVLCVSAGGGAELRLVLTFSSHEAHAFRTPGGAAMTMLLRDVLSAAAGAAVDQRALRHRVGQLETALRRSGKVERAKGIVMAANRCSASEADMALYAAASRAGVPTRDLAERIMNGEVKPWDDGFPRNVALTPMMRSR